MNTPVDTHETTPRADLAVSRREVLGASLLMGTLLLGGCHSSGSASLPGPAWPDTPHNAPPVTPPIGAAPPDLFRPDNVIARSQWTRMGVARPFEINPMNGVNRITVHHSAVDNS